MIRGPRPVSGMTCSRPWALRHRRALGPSPANGHVLNDLQPQYLLDAADGATFRAVSPDSAGEMDPAAIQSRGTPVSGEALIFRPPELLPGR